MNDPHIQEFYLLQGISLSEETFIVLAIASDLEKLVELSRKVSEDYPGAFDAFKITNQGGALPRMAEIKSRSASPTHTAPTTRS